MFRLQTLPQDHRLLPGRLRCVRRRGNLNLHQELRRSFALGSEHQAISAIDPFFRSTTVPTAGARPVEGVSFGAEEDGGATRLALVEDIAISVIRSEAIREIRRTVRLNLTAEDDDRRRVNRRSIGEASWTTKESFT